MLCATCAEASQFKVASEATIRPKSAISTEGLFLSAFLQASLSAVPSETAISASAFACAALMKKSASAFLSFVSPFLSSLNFKPALVSTFSASSLAFFASGFSFRISSATMLITFFVLNPSISGSMSSSRNISRIACFHACEETRARVVPP